MRTLGRRARPTATTGLFSRNPPGRPPTQPSEDHPGPVASPKTIGRPSQAGAGDSAISTQQDQKLARPRGTPDRAARERRWRSSPRAPHALTALVNLSPRPCSSNPGPRSTNNCPSQRHRHVGHHATGAARDSNPNPADSELDHGKFARVHERSFRRSEGTRVPQRTGADGDELQPKLQPLSGIPVPAQARSSVPAAQSRRGCRAGARLRLARTGPSTGSRWRRCCASTR